MSFAFNIIAISPSTGLYKSGFSKTKLSFTNLAFSPNSFVSSFKTYALTVLSLGGTGTYLNTSFPLSLKNVVPTTSASLTKTMLLVWLS